ncbi:MAG: hypothetical protein ACO3I1_06545 [Burkholderiales bacterium]
MKLTRQIIISALILSTMGCQGMDMRPVSGSSQQTAGFDSFTRDVTKFIFVPPDSELVMEKSIVLGKDEDWVGKLVVVSSENFEESYVFIRDAYLEKDWNLKTTHRSDTALLIFEKAGRLITIEFSQRALTSKRANIIFTVSNE